MFGRRWFKKLGYRLVREDQFKDTEKWLVENLDQQKKIADLEDKLLQARAVSQRPTFENREVIDSGLGDPSPTDKEKRAEYVALVAGLHNDILKPKLKHMISNTLKEMELLQNDRDLDLIFKGVVFALREMIYWGDSMVNEQVANQTGENPASAVELQNNNKKENED